MRWTIVSRKIAHRAPYMSVKEGGGRSFEYFDPYLTTKECPCHVYSDSMPLRQIIGQTITDNRTTSSFKVESWWHTTLCPAPCHCEHGVAWCIPHSVLLHKDALQSPSVKYKNFLASDMHSTWGCASQTLCDSQGGRVVLIRVNFDPIQEIGGWALFRKTTGYTCTLWQGEGYLLREGVPPNTYSTCNSPC